LCRFCPRRALPVILLAIIISSPFLLSQISDRYTNICYLPGGLTRCLYGFCIGALGYMFWKRKAEMFFRELGLVACSGFEILTIGASLTLVSMAGAGPLSLLCAPVFVITVLVFAHEGGLIGSFLRLRPLTFVGMLSYSIYMTHEFVQARFLNVIGGAAKYFWLPITKGDNVEQTITNASGIYLAADLTVVLMVSIVIGSAYLSYLFIEEPFRKWSRGEMMLFKRVKDARS
jgi:peptidoglycan/LPS O-acetylase OafA/YrhL